MPTASRASARFCSPFSTARTVATMVSAALTPRAHCPVDERSPGQAGRGGPACRGGPVPICHHGAMARLPLLVGVMLLGALVAGACSSDEPSLVVTDAPAPTTVAEPSPGSGDDDDDGGGDNDGEVLAEAPTPTPTGATATSVPTATPSPTPTPTAGATATAGPTSEPQPGPGGCTAGLAGDPTATVEAPADLDGDGAPDLVTTYVLADGSWRLRVDTSAGESLDSALDILPGPEVVRPVGSVDLDGDPASEELLVVVGAGAATDLVALFTRDRCDLVQVTAVGVPITFPIGASIGAVGGLECVDEDGDGAIHSIVAWSGIANFEAGEGVYDIDGVVYELTGASLEPVGNRTLQAQVGQADFVYGQLSCGTLSL